MFEKFTDMFKKLHNKEKNLKRNKEEAKERLHLVLMQDRANVSADFLDLMKKEIIDVIKKYIDIDEKDMDVKLTNKVNNDGTTGAPALYANIPIIKIRSDARKAVKKQKEEEKAKEKAEKLAQAEKQEDKNKKEKVKTANNNKNEENKTNNKKENQTISKQKTNNKKVQPKNKQAKPVNKSADKKDNTKK